MQKDMINETSADEWDANQLECAISEVVSLMFNGWTLDAAVSRVAQEFCVDALVLEQNVDLILGERS